MSVGLDIFVLEMSRYLTWARREFPAHAEQTLALWRDLAKDRTAHPCYREYVKRNGVE